VIERYWREMFGAWTRDGVSYELPGFPESLMSPRFGTRNRILPLAPGAGADTWLCYFTRGAGVRIAELREEPLDRAVARDEFWRLQEAVNPAGLPFLRRLAPFLVAHRLPHRHLWLADDGGGTVATLLAGETPSSVFLFNLAVAPAHRGRGTARRLVDGARGRFADRPAFYWTRHPGFFLGADEVYRYSIDGRE
jgi:hypothetical protein